MNADLDRRIDLCAARLAGAVSGGSTAEFFQAVLGALRCMPGGMVRDDEGRELIDRDRLHWLIEQATHKLTEKLDDGIVRSELDAEAKAAIASELRCAFSRGMAAADSEIGTNLPI